MGVATAAIIAGAVVAGTKITQAAMKRRQERQLLEAGWTPEDQELYDKLNRLQAQGRGLDDAQLRQQQLLHMAPVNAAAQQNQNTMMEQLGMQGAGVGTTARALQQSAIQQQQLRAQAAAQIAQANINQYQANQQNRLNLGAQKADIEAQDKASKTARTAGVLTGIGSGVSTALGAYQSGLQEQELVEAPNNSLTPEQQTAVQTNPEAAQQTYGFGKSFVRGLNYGFTGSFSGQPQQIDPDEQLLSQTPVTNKTAVPDVQTQEPIVTQSNPEVIEVFDASDITPEERAVISQDAEFLKLLQQTLDSGDTIQAFNYVDSYARLLRGN